MIIKFISRATRHGKASAQVGHPESFSPIGTSRWEELRSEYLLICGFFKEHFIRFLKNHILITLNSHSTSNEQNSEGWNVLHPVFTSNFTNESFRFLEQSGWSYKYAICHMSWWHPESLAGFGPSAWEEFDDSRRHLARPPQTPPLYRRLARFARSPW